MRGKSGYVHAALSQQSQTMLLPAGATGNTFAFQDYLYMADLSFVLTKKI